MPWLIVLGEREAIAWVLKHRRMAVSAKVHTLPERGDEIALYTTRGAFGNPTRDRSQVVALGSVTAAARSGDVTVARKTYATSFPIAIDIELPLRHGLPFEPLVRDLSFIKTKETWGGALRRPVVRIAERDYDLIRRRFFEHERQLRRSAHAEG